MNGALRHPALQGAAGVGAFVALTWPLLVFDRPMHVLISFFVIWCAVIGLLFVFSRAPEGPEPATSGDGPSSDGAASDQSTGGRDARSH
jgi:hypothetical protein